MINFSFFISVLFLITSEPITNNKNEISSNAIKLISTEELNQKKNLILAAISNYGWTDVAIFFKSYEMSNFENCDFIIFAINMTQTTLDKIKSCGIIIKPIPEKYIKIPILSSRWKIYEEFLNDNPNKYNLVFTSDVRDTYFQRDLFKSYSNIKKSFLGIAIEDGFLSQEPQNKNWLINTYGANEFNKIKNGRIICAGTVWGSFDKFIEFSKIMKENLSTDWALRLNAVDQAVANFLIYHDKVFNDCLIISENRDGPVMTIGLTNRALINIDENNNILNLKGEIVSVVHQYDRKADIVKLAINKYYPNLEKEIMSELLNKIIPFFIAIIFIILFFVVLCYICSYRSKNKLKMRKISSNKNERKYKIYNFLLQ